MWRLALAASPEMNEAKERLKQAGVPVNPPVSYKAGKVPPPSSIEELSLMRTMKLASLPKQEGSDEYYLLLSAKGIEDVQPVTTTSANAIPAIRSADYNLPFPDNGPEKIVRRGIITCSEYTKPSCSLVLYATSSTPAPPASAPVAPQAVTSAPAPIAPESVTAASAPPAGFSSPQLVYKVDPKYTEEDGQAKREGAVMLKIIVNQEGVPEDITIFKSLSPGLDQNAKECVAKWRFKPGTKDGKPVKMNATVEVRFQLFEKPSGA